MIRTTTLPNGARIVTEVVDSVYSAAIDLWIEVGSAYETPANSGVSHCIEHMLFKGTKTRSAELLMEEIEDVGGMLGASTSRELTKLYGHVLGEALPVAVDIMLDMVKNPLFRSEDLTLERKVIIDEIEMYDDDPADFAQELVYRNIWPDSPQGRSITGDAKNVKNISVSMMKEHYKRFFRPERMIVSVAGCFDEEKTIAALTAGLSDLERLDDSENYLRTGAPATASFNVFESWDTDMSQLILTMPGLDVLDKRQMALSILDLCLASSASSRLFKEVREKRGLVYNIGSMQHSYRNCGIYGIECIVSPSNANEVMQLVQKEFENIKESGLTDKEIARAKSQLRTDLLMDKETMSARSTGNAGDLLFFDRIIPIEERQEQIEAVTNEEIIAVARAVFAAAPSVVLVGPEAKPKRTVKAGDSKAHAKHKGRVRK